MRNTFATGHKIICGDYNLVLNEQIDRYGSTNNNKKALDVLQQYIEDCELMDIWRVRHPSEQQYTWKRLNPSMIALRLDFFLIDTCINTWTESCEIKTCVCMDHSLVMLTLDKKEVTRGPGVWKMNNTLLTDENCVKEVEAAIDTCALLSMDDTAKWEFTKQKCIDTFKKHARKKANSTKILTENLYHLKQMYEDKYLLEHDVQTIRDAYEAITTKIEHLEEEKANSAIFRSRARWANEGEKNTKYFFALEKHKYMNKNMFAVYMPDGSLLTSQKDILQEQYRFYKTLYTRDDDISFNLQNSGPKISKEAKIQCDTSINSVEIDNAVKMMKNNKCPGSDGLSLEFYKTFWPKLSPLYMNMINKAIEDGQLCPSARQGLMQLIPKKDKDTRYIKNMRPLTLLNNDYKIFATAIAQRLKGQLEHIIGEQQSRFMEGRTIHSNIRHTMDILDHLGQQDNSEEFLLISLDFIKCSETSITQFADDARIFIKYSKQCLQEVMRTLEKIRQNTGLTISEEKSVIYRIGALKNTGKQLKIPDCNMTWLDNDIDMLGIKIANEATQSMDAYEDIIKKMRNIAQQWALRSLTLMGKVFFINTLMASLFVYKLTVLPDLTSQQLDSIHHIILNFLWNGGKPKIPLEILQLPKREGGLGLTNFAAKNRSLHMHWIARIFESEYLQSYVYDWLIPEMGEWVWDCNLYHRDVDSYCRKRSFWSDVLQKWCELTYYYPVMMVQIKQQILWYNSHIKIAGECIKPPAAILNAGVWKVQQLIDDHGALLKYERFCERFDCDPGWL